MKYSRFRHSLRLYKSQFFIERKWKIREKREQISDAWWFHVPIQWYLSFKSFKQQFSNNNLYLNLMCFYFSGFNFEKLLLLIVAMWLWLHSEGLKCWWRYSNSSDSSRNRSWSIEWNTISNCECRSVFHAIRMTINKDSEFR